jgi:hypothetical protein
MKRIAIALFVTAAALAATSARADTRVSIGVNVGSPSYRPAPPTVVYAPAPTVVVAPAHGYWKEIVVKTWVPERWVVRHNRWGRPERYCEPGYYAYRTDRVWVAGRPDHRGRDRDYGYGYEDRRHDDRGRWSR